MVKISKLKLKNSFNLDWKFYYMYKNGFAYVYDGKTAKRITKNRFLLKRSERYSRGGK